MNRINLRPLLSTAFLAAVAAAAGCQEQSDEANRAAATGSRHAKPGPEESFELIVETFRRGVEDVPIGFVLRDSEGHSMMTGRNEVRHKLIPPAKAGDPYKAVITVGSQSRYSIQRSTSEEDEGQEQAAEQRTDILAEEEEQSDIQVFDPDLIGPSGDTNQKRRTAKSASEKPDKTVTRQADKQERNYELVYEDGKWMLVTPLDPETEQSIQNAFKRALEMQI
jgi:hypothetical protein